MIAYIPVNEPKYMHARVRGALFFKHDFNNESAHPRTSNNSLALRLKLNLQGCRPKTMLQVNPNMKMLQMHV